jgi:NTE family protein
MYEVGVLRRLLVDERREYDIFAGVSVGALNAAFLAQFGHENQQSAWSSLKALWDGMDDSKVYKNWPIPYVSALWKPSVYDSSPLQKLVRSQLSPSLIRTSGKLLRVGATGLDTGTYKVFTESYDDICGAVLASSAFPGLLCPISLEGQLWSDGGVRSTTPLAAAIQAGATDVDVVLCSPASDPSTSFSGKTTVIPLALRAIGLMSDQIEDDDLQMCKMTNSMMHAGGLAEQTIDKRFVSLRIVRPAKTLVDNPLDFTPSLLKQLFDQGALDGVKQLPIAAMPEPTA